MVSKQARQEAGKNSKCLYEQEQAGWTSAYYTEHSTNEKYFRFPVWEGLINQKREKSWEGGSEENSGNFRPIESSLSWLASSNQQTFSNWFPTSSSMYSMYCT